jgi:hypothetical protein
MFKIAAIIFFSVVATNAGAQGIPTFDYTTAMNFVKTLQNDITKIGAQQGIQSNTSGQLAAMVGSRAMGMLSNPNAVNNLPTSMSALQGSSNTTSTINTNAILSAAQIAKMPPAQQALIARTRALAAMQQSMAVTSMQVTQGQQQEIAVLQQTIDNPGSTNDAKTIADLNASLAAKKLELANTQNQLFAMQQQLDAEDKLIKQQQNELAMQLFDNTQRQSIHLTMPTQ